jgi:hypothetical protein
VWFDQQLTIREPPTPQATSYCLHKRSDMRFRVEKWSDFLKGLLAKLLMKKD